MNGLLSFATSQPLPGHAHHACIQSVLTRDADYWTTLLFKQLVGTRVLAVANSTDFGRTLRVYAFCSRNISGGVAVVAINTEPHPATFTFSALPNTPRVEYQLTAPGGNMSSPDIELNGVVLELSGGALPHLGGHVVTDASPVTLQPTSYAILVFPEAAAPACVLYLLLLCVVVRCHVDLSETHFHLPCCCVCCCCPPWPCWRAHVRYLRSA